MLTFPGIFCIPKHVIVCLDGFASLRDIGSHKGYKSHFSDHEHKKTVFCGNRINFRYKADIRLPSLHQDGFFHAGWHPKKWWIALRGISSWPPALFFKKIVLSYLITFTCCIDCLLKNFIENIIALDSKGGCPLNKNKHNL